MSSSALTLTIPPEFRSYTLQLVSWLSADDTPGGIVTYTDTQPEAEAAYQHWCAVFISEVRLYGISVEHPRILLRRRPGVRPVLRYLIGEARRWEFPTVDPTELVDEFEPDPVFQEEEVCTLPVSSSSPLRSMESS